MANVFYDRVKETASAPGTGTVTLLGAVSGYQSFAAVGNGNTTYYCIEDQSGSNWEVGVGTYTSSGTTLSRTTVLASSNSGSLVNFSTGTQNVFVTYPAGKAIDSQIIETVFAVSGTTPALSPVNGTIQTWTLSASSTPTAASSWVAGQGMTLMITAGANTITWTSLPVTWVGGVAPTLSTTVVTIIELWKVGTTIYGAYVGAA